ncbi:MAG TPA: endonuclease III [Phycisphaerae bacterium]|nr:endonuclease III [Phycisphaerae bacterium]
MPRAISHANMPRGEGRRKTERMLKLLTGAYGRPRQRRAGAAVDVLVATILSQNTSGANSSAGFESLKRHFGSWDAAADAPVAAIERCIRVSGLSRRKAPRIRNILRQIRAETGRVSLDFLRARRAQEAYDYLVRFDGVGPKTALCVLMFSFNVPVFPVDTHVYRICSRLGLLGSRTPGARAHEVLGPMIAPGNRQAMHLLLIAHGRRTCRARRPACRSCCLLGLCRFAKRRAERKGKGA